MPDQYLSTDPTAGTAVPSGYLSMDPSAGQPAATPASAPARFAEQFWQRANPLTWAEGLIEAAKHPLDTAVNAVRADPKFLAEAKAAADKGDLATAGRKVLSFLAMGFGHDLDTQADMLQKGDYAGGAGAMAGTATQFLAPEAAIRGASAVTNRVAQATRMAPANPAIADAVQFGQARGVPMDAATATDNTAVRAVQHVADRSIGGAQVAQKAAQRQAEGLATVGEQLAQKAHPQAVTPELAGQGVRDALHGQIRNFDTEADTAYARLREIADQHRETVTTRSQKAASDEAPPRFTNTPAALPDQVFEAAYQDARKNGYTGTKGELRTKFDEQLASGYRGLDEVASSEYAPEALLKSIRQYGGIKPFTKDYVPGAPIEKLRGDFASLVESFGAKSGYAQRGGASIFRNEGLGLDEMVDRLKHDRQWGSTITDENALLDSLDEIARDGRTTAGKPGVEDALALSNARPGSQWWVDRVEQEQALPVNLTGVREKLTPIYQALQQEREVNGLMMGQKGVALNALTTLMKAGDYAPLEIADKALSDLKAMARGKGGLPELRTEGQGVAAQAVKLLDAEVRRTAANAGPEAMKVLEQGRAATRTKYAIAEVYKDIADEPVKAFSQAVSPQDSAIAQLRDVAQHAPDELPKIGRAYLDSLLGKATESGAFTHADKLFADWHRMGPQTKQLLFKDPAYIKELDNFFLLSKQMAKTANASGTAHTAAIAAQGGALLHALWTFDLPGFAAASSSVGVSAGLSAFLHSPTGVKLLTEGLRLPRRSMAAQEAWLLKVRRLATAQGVVQATRPTEERQPE